MITHTKRFIRIFFFPSFDILFLLFSLLISFNSLLHLFLSCVFADALTILGIRLATEIHSIWNFNHFSVGNMAMGISIYGTCW